MAIDFSQDHGVQLHVHEDGDIIIRLAAHGRISYMDVNADQVQELKDVLAAHLAS